jgi:hypothetical protein
MAAGVLLAAGVAARAEIKVTTDRNDNDHTKPGLKFKNVPAAATDDLATKAKFVIADGERDENSGELEKLHDGKLPTEEDQPDENFFFSAGTDGGRLQIDLGSAAEVKQINTYSWHPNTRGPQVYKVYGSEGTGDGFNAKPKKGTDPEKAGWKLIAKVNTRSKGAEDGGQYGVSIADSEKDKSLGKFRYLLFDVSQTEDDDSFGNTFYSEIDVIGAEK